MKIPNWQGWSTSTGQKGGVKEYANYLLRQHIEFNMSFMAPTHIWLKIPASSFRAAKLTSHGAAATRLACIF